MMRQSEPFACSRIGEDVTISFGLARPPAGAPLPPQRIRYECDGMARCGVLLGSPRCPYGREMKDPT
jgi:hypothetical protein